MFWRHYGHVIGILLLVGALAGGALFLAFPMLVPPDDGEDGMALRVILVLWGALLGGGVALVASAGFAAVLALWIRSGRRSAITRALIGAAGAAGGAAMVWIVVGTAWPGTSAWVVWGPLALISAVAAGTVAGPLTARAARRADAAAAASAPWPAAGRA